jgi:energy-coupling factor transporter ATP-binding protein EcfA2
VRFVNGKFYELSSGEISFLKFSAQVSLYIENGSLILLDEPETHLHPHFISRFVDLLNNLLEGTNSSAIIATHSVYFVREVFQSQVIILRSSDNGRIIADTPIFRTFGADVGAISYFVFGEDEPSHLAASVQRRLLAKYKNWDDLYNDYKDELSLEVLGAIREAMELINKDE